MIHPYGLLTIVNLKENLSNLKTFFVPNPIKIQSPDAIFYPTATKPIINQALPKLPMNQYIWPSPFSQKINWKVGITPPDKAGHQTWRSIILWNMTMMSDYWINVYFVLQYLLCLSPRNILNFFSKSRSSRNTNQKGVYTSVYLPVSFVGEGKSW